MYFLEILNYYDEMSIFRVKIQIAIAKRVVTLRASEVPFSWHRDHQLQLQPHM